MRKKRLRKVKKLIKKTIMIPKKKRIYPLKISEVCETNNNLIHIICFVKNGISFINKFIEHHLKIVDKITFIDNGSSDGTIEVIKSYNLELLFCDNFNKKGQFCTEVMLNSTFDLLIPLDIDELLVFDDGKTVDASPEKIKNYLKKLVLNGSKYKIRKTYEFHPDNDGWFDIKDRPKMIFPRQTFISTDCGFHRGRTSLDKNYNFDNPYYWRSAFKNIFFNDSISNINISYIHFHYFSEQIWLKNIEMKLKSHVGDKWNNILFLKKYKGINQTSKREYIRYKKNKKWHNLEKKIKINI